MPSLVLVHCIFMEGLFREVTKFWLSFQVVILARECGLQLELDDIKVQSLVPKPLQVCMHYHMLSLLLFMFKYLKASLLQELSSIDEFLNELPNFDEQMESQRKDAEASGEVFFFILFFVL